MCRKIFLSPFLPAYFCLMGILRQFAEYLYIKKRDPNQPVSQWTKYMHGMNRISLLMFLVAVIIIIVKLVFFKHK